MLAHRLRRRSSINQRFVFSGVNKVFYIYQLECIYLVLRGLWFVMSEITTRKSSWLPSTKQSVSEHAEHYSTFTWLTRFLVSQQTQNMCTTFVQCWTNVFDVGPTLCKCYTDVLS